MPPQGAGEGKRERGRMINDAVTKGRERKKGGVITDAAARLVKGRERLLRENILH